MKSYLRDTVLTTRTRHLLTEPGFHWTYAERDGGLVLRTETHWTKINGFIWNSGKPGGCFRHPQYRQVWLQLRRKYRPFR